MRRSGFTLVETLLVVVVAGVILSIGFPRMRDAKIKSDLRSARTTVASMYARTRAAAVQMNRFGTMTINGNMVVVTVPRVPVVGANTIDTVGAVQNLQTSYGATIAATSSTLLVDPRGLGANGSDVVIRVSRGGYTDSVRVSRFGRIR
jgi:prepilin-type N-terminal cleavage/methylation domain-containing protein